MMIHLNTRAFHYFREERAFVAESSDLEHEHPSLHDHDQISLQSEKTGESKLFTYVQRVHDEEGDTLHWEYKSEDGFLIKILND